MKKGLLTTIAILLVLPIMTAFAQSDYTPSIDWHGFVKTDIFYDTRQMSTVREGHFSVMPMDEKLNADGEDLNAEPSFNILSIQTRLNGKIAGPEIYGIKTSGFIEGAFFGTSNGDVNGFRLRHAFVDMNWENAQLRVGQYWHPMFITGCFPNVVSFNTGVPFQPFSRNPQVRFTYKMGALHIMAAALSQRDFTSTGPGGASSIYAMNSGMPELDLQVSYNSKNFLIGATGLYKTLRPVMVTSLDNINDNKISSIGAQGYMKLALKPITLKLEGTYGQNMTNLVMFGGYGYKSYDATTGIADYSNSNMFSGWGEINYDVTENFSLNVFGGYTMNMGFDDNLVMVDEKYAFGRALDAENMLRVTPYFRWKLGKVQIAGELEYSTVNYGTPNYAEDKGKVEETHSVSNLRSLIAVYISF